MNRFDLRLEAVMEGIVRCPSADALRYPSRASLRQRIMDRAGTRWKVAARADAARLLRDLQTVTPALVIIGPGADPGLALTTFLQTGVPTLDFSGRTAGAGTDPKRRTLEEGWFTAARVSAGQALAALTECLPPELATSVHAHAEALHLRLKNDIALRLRRLDIARHVLAAAGPGRIILIEGDDPMDAHEIAIRSMDRPVDRVCLPLNAAPYVRNRAREGVLAKADSNAAALARVMTKWRPRLSEFAGRGLLAADLRKRRDFRHAAAAHSLLEAIPTKLPGRGSVLLQPYTRLTRNTFRAIWIARSLNATTQLVRQPQAEGLNPSLAPFRAHCLISIDKRLGSGLSKSDRAAVLEACGGFIVSSLGPSLALCAGLVRAMRRSPPAFVLSVPLGSPFGGLVVSAAREARTPTAEVQTLMIGVSDRDPPPIADRVAVLDTEQQAIFQRRFHIPADRFILAGAFGAAAAPANDEKHRGGGGVLYASQPLDAVCLAAAEILAAACVEVGERLSIAPHPDETEADIDAYRTILARYPTLRGDVLPRGSAVEAMAKHSVLATLVSNMALWAAAREIDVLVVDVGVEVPLDFARMGVAVKVASPSEAAEVMSDFKTSGPISRSLGRSRDAYFRRNPQLKDQAAARRIVEAMGTLTPPTGGETRPTISLEQRGRGPV